LVLVEQLGEQVARRQKIARQFAAFAGQIRQLRGLAVAARDQQIAPVQRHGFAQAGEMPAAKPIGDRHGVARLLAAKGPLAAAGKARNDRLDHQPRDVLHVPRGVAVHAVG
jgi:hypothetical protein